ncbi:helix-turn-helix domain-containing protein [Halotia branconii]|uniref:Helix-turn-helix transcriptional regulator n=1 Tax=Halotia branconii CENA392 TaxID=1539056 RepID=A0AAJ6P7V0_9CYAN|nr:helix-turn-helix transcriptional regulator [Halotia branconii]WGV24011.1 helix-turn-helix transcriptional regulator [Halotia branconii CENA392]
MKKRNLSKTVMAQKIGTSRSSLDRLLDPNNTSVTLETIERAAKVVGKRVKFELVDI